MNIPKILLINPRYGNTSIKYFPLGLGYIAGACSANGISVKCLDMNIKKYTANQIIDEIKIHDYKIVGIGGFAMQIKSSIELANSIKNKINNVIVVLGGVQVYGCEKLLMENSKADILFVGEAEISLPRVVNLLYQGKDYSKEPSIIFRKGTDIIYQESFSLVDDLDKLPFPKYDLFDMEEYIGGNYHAAAGRRTIDFLCSRGCPHKCNFCINSKRPVRMRYRSTENILKEIRLLKDKYNINDFSFCDEIFTLNKRKALEICEAIKNEKITWVTSGRADNLDRNLLLAMKKSGCRMLLIGFESGSPKILQSMNKNSLINKYYDAINLLREVDLPFYANFMTGMPMETEETIHETEIFCKNNHLVFGSSFVTPFPGTQLYDDVKNKIKDEKTYVFSMNAMDFSKKPIINLTAMSIKQLVQFRNRAVVNSMTHIIKNKLKTFPLSFIYFICTCYMFLFSINNSIMTKILRPINKFIYMIFSK